MKYYPIALKLDGEKIAVVGGGKVAERKISGLLKAGAFVRIISPYLTPRLKNLADKGRIEWRSRPVRRKDIAGTAAIVAATSDRCINADVSAWAKSEGIPVNVVDDKALSDFISPAVIRKHEVIAAIYTDGRDPKLSRDLKNFLKERWDEFLSYRNGL